MSHYATVADVEAYIEGWTTEDEAALERLIERAELDVDAVVGPWPVEANGRKFGLLTENPKNLADYQSAALKRATCAQVEYRFTMGEDHFTRAPAGRVSGPDFTVDHGDAGPPPRLGPKTVQELRGAGLIVRSARARP